MTLFNRTSGGGETAALHAHLGAELYRSGLYARAAQEFQCALDKNPHSADLCNDLAVILTAQGLYDEAIAALRRALTLNPAHVEAQRNLTLALHAAGLAN